MTEMDHIGPRVSRKALTPRDELDGPYIDIKIQGVTVNLLVDTGSNCTIITTKLTTKPALINSIEKISVANGSQIPSVGYANFEINVGHTKLHHTIWVAVLRVGCLLGWDKNAK